ncbi:MAG: putative DNA-binding protein [Frankiales bacterium]|nr:putative DNA-binding protein [Frankiales bacterium]
MRELHVVAVSEDGRHVVLATRRGSSNGAFKVALDATLAAALRGDLPRPGDEEVPDISPKEIQARLRAGESAEKIARSAGVPLARVERYGGPVEGEMARIIDAARTAYLVRGRLGRSAVDLGTAVDAALHAGGADDEAGDWSTYRREDGSWLVTVRWYARKRSRAASWSYDPGQKVVTPTDPSSAALAHQESAAVPVRRKPTPAPMPAKKPVKKAVKRPVTKKAPAKKPVAKKAPVKKPVAKKAPVKKAPVKKAAAKKAPVKKAPAKKAPVRKPVAKKAPAKKAPVKVPARPHRVLRVVPDPLPSTVKAGGKRASVPAWADVLLGTTPGADR